MDGSPARQRPFCKFLEAVVGFADPREDKAGSRKATRLAARALDSPSENRFKARKDLKTEGFFPLDERPKRFAGSVDSRPIRPIKGSVSKYDESSVRGRQALWMYSRIAA